MATFIAKHLVGKQLDSVKGALGDKGDNNNDSKNEIDPEIEAAIRENEEKRLDKHRKMEEERENMRQGIRDKYGLKKKENFPIMDEYLGSEEGKCNRTRKSTLDPNGDSCEDDTIIGNVKGFANRVTEVPKQLVTEATDKCHLM